MNKSRLKLDEMLKEILSSNEVYFQRPQSKAMSYPAIVYTRSKINNDHADNKVYRQTYAYVVTVMDKNPDSAIVEKVSKLPKCKFDTHYTKDGLNHDVFIINI